MSHKSVSLFILMVISGLSLLVASCSKNSSDNVPVGLSTQINGQSYLAKQTSASLFSGGGGYYLVGGAGTFGGDTVTLTIYIAAPITLNKKVCTDTNAYAELDYLILKGNAPYADYTAAYGDLDSAYYTITALDTIRHTISGTFSGTITISSNVGNLPDSLVMANGRFNTTYQ
jgi:hypothetical protein